VFLEKVSGSPFDRQQAPRNDPTSSPLSTAAIQPKGKGKKQTVGVSCKKQMKDGIFASRPMTVLVATRNCNDERGGLCT
jgi:hypothetical protein